MSHLSSLLACVSSSNRSPALIGCFVVDREYFEEIGLLDEGMEVYGGENVELGIRVRDIHPACKSSESAAGDRMSGV